ncbi:hypothetical protein J6590_044174 [Homalodisca vitripennis]|nr:hypothetical protein J6590_044174 [Homalodisca vitripennis]
MSVPEAVEVIIDTVPTGVREKQLGITEQGTLQGPNNKNKQSAVGVTGRDRRYDSQDLLGVDFTRAAVTERHARLVSDLWPWSADCRHRLTPQLQIS